MNKKGFTLIELLGVFVIIGLLTSAAIIGYQNLVESSTYTYYKTTENSILMAAGEFFKQNKMLRPVGDDISEVTIKNLVNSGFIEEIKDVEGNACYKGNVYATLNDDGTNYQYAVCMTDCGEYLSSTNACRTLKNKKYSAEITTYMNKNGEKVEAYYDGSIGDWTNEDVKIRIENKNSDITKIVIKEKEDKEQTQLNPELKPKTLYVCDTKKESCQYIHKKNEYPDGRNDFIIDWYIGEKIEHTSEYTILKDTFAPEVNFEIIPTEINGKETTKLFITTETDTSKALVDYNITVKKPAGTSKILSIEVLFNDDNGLYSYPKRNITMWSYARGSYEDNFERVTTETGTFTSGMNRSFTVTVNDFAGNNVIIQSPTFQIARPLKIYDKDNNYHETIYAINNQYIGYKDQEGILKGLPEGKTYYYFPESSGAPSYVNNKIKLQKSWKDKIKETEYLGCKIKSIDTYTPLDEINLELELIGDPKRFNSNNSYALNIYKNGSSNRINSFPLKETDLTKIETEGILGKTYDQYANIIPCDEPIVETKTEYSKQICKYELYQEKIETKQTCDERLNNTITTMNIDGQNIEVLQKITCDEVTCNENETSKNCYNNNIKILKLSTCNEPSPWQEGIIYPGASGQNEYIKVSSRELYKITNK